MQYLTYMQSERRVRRQRLSSYSVIQLLVEVIRKGFSAPRALRSVYILITTTIGFSFAGTGFSATSLKRAIDQNETWAQEVLAWT